MSIKKLKRSTFFQLSVAISLAIIAIEIVILYFSYLSKEKELEQLEAFNQTKIVEMYGESKGPVISKEFIDKKLNGFVFNVTGLVAIVVFSTTISFLFVHYLVAGRYFMRLMKFTNEFDPRERKTIPAKLIPDTDLGDLFLAFNKMIMQIEEYSTRLNQEQAHNMHTEKLASLGEIAASVAHEINNPLAISIGYLEILRFKTGKLDIQNPAVEKSISESISKIENASYRIKKIVESLKPLSQKEGELTKSFLLNTVIEGTINLIEDIYSSEGIEIEYVAEEDFYISGSEDQMNQILMNLFTNAKQAINEAKTENKLISLKLSRLNNEVLMDFKDNGPGIPEEVRDKIFDPFFSTKDVNEGTGLGLSIVQKMITRGHSGQIKIGRPESGCQFVITIPLVENIDDQEQEEKHA